MGARQVFGFLQGLSKDSALRRAVDPNGANWGSTQELLAALVETVDFGNRLFFSANAKKGAKPPKPIQINRPGRPQVSSKKAPRKQSTSEQMKRFLGRAVRFTGDKEGD